MGCDHASVPSVRRVGALPSSGTIHRSTTRSRSAVSWGPCGMTIASLSFVHENEGATSWPPVRRTRCSFIPLDSTTNRERGRSTIHPTLSYFQPRWVMRRGGRSASRVGAYCASSRNRAAKAIDRPSGDHSSASISSGSVATTRGSPPTPPIGSTSSCEPLSSRWLVNASDRPSGDHRACPSRPEPAVRGCAGADPSTGASHTCDLPMLAVRSAVATVNATCRASGESRGSAGTTTRLMSVGCTAGDSTGQRTVRDAARRDCRPPARAPRQGAAGLRPRPRHRPERSTPRPGPG